MSDREFGGGSSDDLSLPKATVQKILTEILPPSEGLATSKDFRDAFTEACVEFITLVASEANEISEKEQKKTIACEHITSALKDLGFQDFIPAVQESAEEHKRMQATREKKQNKFEQSGLSQEELMRQQEELFRSATAKFNEAPQE